MKSTAIEKILKCFNVSREDAEIYATEFIRLVEAKGGIVSLSVIENQIPKVFEERLEWRNETVKNEFEEKKRITVASYNKHISGKSKSKW